MVILKRLIARNFRKLDLEIDFHEGIYIIRGPNEAGKSTILEAVLYALFGKLMRGVKELAINHKSNRALIDLFFIVNEREYEVIRVIKRNGLTEAHLYELRSDGKKLLIANGVQKVNREIEKIIGGLSYNEILVTNVVAQKDLERIIHLKQDREKIINALIGLESYNKAIDKIRRDRSILKNTLEAKKDAFKKIEERYEDYKSHINELRTKETILSDKKRELEKIGAKINEINEILNALKEYKKALETKMKLEKELENVKTYLNYLKEDEKEIKKQIMSMNKDLIKINENLSNFRNELSIKEKKKEKYREIDKARKILEKIRVLDREYSDNESKISDLEEKIKRNEVLLKKIEKELSLVDIEKIKREENELKELRNQQKVNMKILATGILFIIPALKLPYLAFLGISIILYALLEYYNRIRKISHQLTELDKKYRDIKLKMQQRDELVFNLRKDREKLLELKKRREILTRDTMKIISTLDNFYKPAVMQDMRTLYDKLQEKINLRIREYDKLIKDIDGLIDKINNSENSIEKIRTELSELEEKLREKKAKIEGLERQLIEIRKNIESIVFPKIPHGLTYSDDLLDNYRGEYERLMKSESRIIGEVKQLERDIEHLRQWIEKNKSTEEDYFKYRREINDLELEYEALSKTIEVIREVSSKIRERFIPYVEQYMSEIINYITDGKYKAVRLNKDYSISVFDSSAGRFIPKDIYSGGTIDQFLLAMRLAFILSLVPQTKGTYPKFLFLDEPLSSSDKIRRRNIINLLTKNLRKYFNQIILITHVEDISVKDAYNIKLREGKISNQ